jgi:XTP/dITP diphosphohydrolase
MKLIVATGNPGKLKELENYLSHSGWELALKPAELDVEETGTTFMENACLKATHTALNTNCWAIADDSGLTVDALDGAPGIYSARYADTDARRIDRLLAELGDNPHRHAQFVCAIAIAKPDGSIAATAEGICAGEILHAPRGDGGFGYDPIFYVPSLDLTFAQMSPEQKRAVGHRGRALAALTDFTVP